MEELRFLKDERFLIQKRLGSGGMGVVYQAFDSLRGASVAIKTLKKLSPAGLMLFKNEFRALADLHHPNLIHLYELFSEGEGYFFTMELLHAQDLLEYVCLSEVRPGPATFSGEPLTTPMTFQTAPDLAAWSQGTLPVIEDATTVAPTLRVGYHEERLRAAFRQLALGLIALHRANKIHRDIKPSNIMVVPDPLRVVLMDFGLIAATAETSGQLVGTPVYMSPEQAAALPVGPPTDWYSVGVVLYQALTGVIPFSGSFSQLLRQKQRVPPSPRSLLSFIPEDLDELCTALMQVDPQDRPDGPSILRRLGVIEPSLSVRSLSTPFVGRAEEQHLLRGVLRDSRKGSAVALLVYGESGLGKSALIRHFIEPLPQEANAVVLSGRCYEQEQVPYKAFDGIIDALSRHFMALPLREIAPLLPAEIALLAKVFPVLRQVDAIEQVVSMSLPKDPNELRSRAISALRELFTNMAQRRPLVLFLDDLQWTDKDSLLLLDELLRPPSGAYCIVASVRGVKEELLGERGLLRALTQSKGDLRHLTLSRLPEEDARQLIQKLSGLSGEAAEGLMREAQGHPLFLQELSLYTGDSSSEGGAVARLDDLLFARISRVEEKARTLLELVAVSGAPIEQRNLLHAAQTSPAEFDTLVSLLRSSYLVKTLGRQDTDLIEPYHDRVREAVSARLPAEVKRAHHRRLAELLEQTETAQQEPQTMLRHLEAAGETERAATYALRAVELARSSLAFDQAAEFLMAALRLGSYPKQERQRLRLMLGEFLASAGRGTEAAETFLLVAEEATPELRFDCQRRAAEQLLSAGHLERGTEIMDQVLRGLGESLLTPQQALPALLWHRARLTLRGLGHTLIKESEAPPKELLRLDLYRAIIQSVSPIQPIIAAAYSTKQLRLALDVGEPRRLSYALTGGTAMFALGGPKNLSFAKKLQALISTCYEPNTEDPQARGQMAFSRAALLFFAQGHIGEALRLVREAESHFLQAPDGVKMLAVARSLRVAILGYHQGGYQELKTWGRQLRQDAIRRKDRYSSFAFANQGAVMMLAEDAPEALRQILQENPWSPMEEGYQVQHLFSMRAQGDLALYEGKAASLLAQLRRHKAAIPLSIKTAVSFVCIFWTGGARLCLAAAQGPNDPLLQEATLYLKEMESSGLICAQVHARLIRAALSFQRGKPQEAASLLREVIQSAEQEEMYDAAASARYRLGALLGADEGATLQAQAKEALLRLGAKRPEKMLEVVAPGFSQVR